MSGPRFRPPRAVPLIAGLKPEQQAELQAWLLTMFGQVAEDLQQIPTADSPTIIQTERVDVPARATRRVSPTLSGMVAILAAPSPANAGRDGQITLIIEKPAGELKVVASPHIGADGKVTATLINDAAQATYTLPGVVVFTSNGVDSWKTQAEVPAETAASATGSALIAALDATYHLQAADPNLPSGRVATASADIVPDYSVSGQVSWRESQAARVRSGTPGRDGEDGRRGFPGPQGARGKTGQQGPPGRRVEEHRRPFFAGPTDGWREVLARNRHSGPFNPTINDNQALVFDGSTGIAAGDIRKAGGDFRIRGPSSGILFDASGDTFLSGEAITVTSGLNGIELNAGGQFLTLATTAGSLFTTAAGGAGLIRIVEDNTNTNGAIAGQSQIWVRDDAPTSLIHRNDNDEDHVIAHWDGTAMVSNVTATNATTVLTGASHTIAAGELAVNQVWMGRCDFEFVGSAAPPDILCDFQIGGVSKANRQIPGILNAGTYRGFVECHFTVRSSILIMTSIHMFAHDDVQAEAWSGGDVGTGGVAIVMANAQALTLKMNMVTAVASNTLTISQGWFRRLL